MVVYDYNQKGYTIWCTYVSYDYIYCIMYMICLEYNYMNFDIIANKKNLQITYMKIKLQEIWILKPFDEKGLKFTLFFS